MKIYEVDNYRLPVPGATNNINYEIPRVREIDVEPMTILGIPQLARRVAYEDNGGRQDFIILYSPADLCTDKDAAGANAQAMADRHNRAVISGHEYEAARLTKNVEAMKAVLDSATAEGKHGC